MLLSFLLVSVLNFLKIFTFIYIHFYFNFTYSHFSTYTYLSSMPKQHLLSSSVGLCANYFSLV